MSPNDRFLGVLEKLLKKSEQNLANWTEADRRLSFDEVYELHVDESTRIRVAYATPQSAPDLAEATLIHNGRQIANIEAEDGELHFSLLYQLFHHAKRITSGWDSAMDRIENLLDHDKVIGQQPTKFPDDEVPF